MEKIRFEQNIRFENICKSFDDENVLTNLNLEIPAGKFFALLGPSGCGKTTLLRLLAGLETVDSGKIYLGDQDITNIPIYERRIHTVFQNYALFPHLNVFDNIAYPLQLKGVKTSEVETRVHAMLRSMQLQGYAKKTIQGLSGGQQQRVALARAIINEPQLLLLDEPLAALDPKLKEQMLVELIDLQDKIKTTFVYVTHDQEEALTVSDKMAILNADGYIEQIGAPKDIYEFPISRFVANFVGTTNFFEGILQESSGDFSMSILGLETFPVHIHTRKDWMTSGAHVHMSLRPEKIMISKSEMSGFSNHMQGKVVDIIYYGRSTQYNVELANKKRIKVFEQNEEHVPRETIDYDDIVNLYFQTTSVILLER